MKRLHARKSFASIIYSLLLLALFVPYNDSLPYKHVVMSKFQTHARASRDTSSAISVEATQTAAGADDCLLAPNGSVPKSSEIADRDREASEQLSPNLMVCLNNCANCVKQWRSGVYNGRNCADDCIQYATSEHQPIESVDPDCNLMKYFNATLLASAA